MGHDSQPLLEKIRDIQLKLYSISGTMCDTKIDLPEGRLLDAIGAAGVLKTASFPEQGFVDGTPTASLMRTVFINSE